MIHLSKCPLSKTILNYYMAGGNLPLISGDYSIVDSYRLLWPNVKHRVMTGFLSCVCMCVCYNCNSSSGRYLRLEGVNDKWFPPPRKNV